MASVFGLTSCATTFNDAFYNTCVKYKKTSFIKEKYDFHKDNFNWKDSNDKKTMCKTIAYSYLNDFYKAEIYEIITRIINSENDPDRLEYINKVKDTYYKTCKTTNKIIVDKIYAAFAKDYDSVPSASDVETMCKNIKTIAYYGDLGLTGSYGPNNSKFAP